MSVKEALEKIEELVVDARRVPLVSRTLVNDTDLVHYVEQLRHDLPLELAEADKIKKDRARIISDAKSEAKRIKDEAKRQADRITDQTETIQHAKARAKEIIQQSEEHGKHLVQEAKAEAERKRSEADEYAAKMRAEADEYAAQVNAYNAEAFGKTMDEFQNTFQQIIDIANSFHKSEQVLSQVKNNLDKTAAESRQQAQKSAGVLSARQAEAQAQLEQQAAAGEQKVLPQPE